jgi:hypothetical protein
MCQRLRGKVAAVDSEMRSRHPQHGVH